MTFCAGCEVKESVMNELISMAEAVLETLGSALGWTLDTTGGGTAGQGHLDSGALGLR